MHLSTNLSHLVCVFSGLILIVTGLVSHVPRHAAGLASQVDGTDASTNLIKRSILVVVGLVAVGYGISRVLG